jgi:hypothetical protein
MKFFLEQSRARVRRQPLGRRCVGGIETDHAADANPDRPAGNAGLLSKLGKLRKIGKRCSPAAGIAVQGFTPKT